MSGAGTASLLPDIPGSGILSVNDELIFRISLAFQAQIHEDGGADTPIFQVGEEAPPFQGLHKR